MRSNRRGKSAYTRLKVEAMELRREASAAGMLHPEWQALCDRAMEYPEPNIETIRKGVDEYLYRAAQTKRLRPHTNVRSIAIRHDNVGAFRELYIRASKAGMLQGEWDARCSHAATGHDLNIETLQRGVERYIRTKYKGEP